MGELLFSLIVAIFVYLFCVIFCHKLLDKKINWKDYKIYLAIFILVIGGTSLNILLPQYLKIFGTSILMFLVMYIFFSRNLVKSLLTVIMIELIFMISELSLVLIVQLFGLSMEEFSNMPLGFIVINTWTMIFSFLCLKFKFIYKIFNYLINTFDNMKKSNLIIYFIVTLVLISVFMIMSYMNLPEPFLLVCNCILTIFYVVILFRLANAQEKFKKVNSKYETSLSSLREYEDIMDKYKVANHENKNQLLTIRNMIKTKDCKTADYIDELVDNKIKDNETIFYKTSKIPEGGLRATIYSKLCKMEDMGINYELDIANDVRAVDLIEIGDYTTLNACKIIGVFLDNAIEAVQPLKEKNIIVEIFLMDNELYIDISNNYEGNIELNKLGNKGYTTKGKGHGYGLTLVSNLIKEDKNLGHEKKISKDMFTQRLKIKM